MHPVRHRRRRRPAELAGAAASGEPTRIGDALFEGDNRMPICLIWGTPCKDAGSNDEFYFVDSSRAGGKYKLFGSALVQVKNLTVDEKKVVTTWIISQHRFGIEVPQIVGHNIDEIRRGRRMSFSERVDRALLFLGERSEAVGTCIALNLVSSESRQALDEFLAFTESRDAGEAQLFLRMLGDSMDLVGCVQETLFFLKPNGWLRLDELQSKVVRSSQAFVAMWFNDKLTSAWDLGFRPAIVRAGYSALRIDQKEHANKICDEIIAEIRRSRFVVADYTGHRGGVYYEAGFAAGRDLPVILTCRKSDMATLHFDIRQFNCIDWESTEELAQRLQVRIEALLGGGPLKGTD
jgi:nucleoside 2-deoxyribosyltransferase